MIPFKKFAYKKTLALRQARLLERLVKSKKRLSESRDLDPFFKDNDQVLAIYAAAMEEGAPDRFYHQLRIQNGVHVSDLAYLNSHSGRLLLIELEDANEKSIFQKYPLANPKWSRRFEVGYSQVIDWVYQFDGLTEKDQVSQFGCKINHVEGFLVLGKEAFLDPAQVQRLEWRVKNVEVLRRSVKVITYDGLARQLIRTISINEKLWQ